MTRIKKWLNSLGDRVRRVCLKMLNARYSVASWLWLLVSFATAMVLLLAVLDPTNRGVADFSAALPLLDEKLWASFLILSTVTTGVGMAFDWKTHTLLRYGSFVTFTLWAFGAIAFFTLGQTLSVGVLLLPYIIFYAYLFMSAVLRWPDQA